MALSSSGAAFRKDYLETSIRNRIQKPDSADRCMKPERSLNWYQNCLALRVHFKSRYSKKNIIKIALRSLNLILVPVLFGLYGCGAKIPNCNDAEATDLAKSIVISNIADGKIDVKSDQFIFEFIETVSKDEKTNKSQCKANIIFKPSEESLRIIKLLKKPSIDSSQALFLGIVTEMSDGDLAPPYLIAISGLMSYAIIGGIARDPTQKKAFINDVAIKYSLNPTLYPALFNSLISEELEKDGKAAVNDNLISFKQNQINYLIRKNEDKDSKNNFIVEAKFSSDIAESIIFISNLTKLEKSGKEIQSSIEKMSSTASATATATATAPAPVPAPVPAPAPVPVPVPVPQANNSPFAPSFDCAKANTGPERLICGDRDLAKLDVDVSQAYSKAREKTSDKNQIRTEQQNWMKNSRNACSDKDCMSKAMTQRIQELSK